MHIAQFIWTAIIMTATSLEFRLLHGTNLLAFIQFETTGFLTILIKINQNRSLIHSVNQAPSMHTSLKTCLLSKKYNMH